MGRGVLPLARCPACSWLVRATAKGAVRAHAAPLRETGAPHPECPGAGEVAPVVVPSLPLVFAGEPPAPVAVLWPEGSDDA